MSFSPLQLAIRYISYRRRAHNGRGHGMHSPFVYQLTREILSDKKNYPAYATVEALRKQLLAEETPLEVIDLGAGSSKSAGETRTVASIARHAAKPRKWGQLLFRLARFYQPGNILELGTSLGISTAYLQLGHPDARLVTLEGAPAVAAKAKMNFQQLGLPNIEQVIGNFDDTLPSMIPSFQALDMVFVDGNHRQEPTLRYFELLLPYLHNDSLVVFDDIHWSREMEEAWWLIQQNPAVRCSVDLFFVGLVFFRKEFLEPQHFLIKF